MLLSSSSSTRVVRASAWYDLLVTAPFATPWTYRLLHDALALGGPADRMTVLYANLMGSVVLVWSLLRVLRPLPLHGLLDGVARVLFATWQAYALTQGAAGVVWLFLGVEVAWGVAQLAPWARRNARENLAELRPETP
ncbi:hypothetical protein ACIRTB_07200 [Streptomyces sp. NPDC101158]|uniref:hypothetical protein n=1 Tax=Streptomyces sp. NPDC101158 TaxID=3366117 RepID=UPI00381467D3